LLTFAVVGGGPTGVELAGAIAEIARRTLRREFHRVDPTDARVLLIEGGERLLAAFPPSLARHALSTLEQLGVEVWLKSKLVGVAIDSITVECEGRRERLACRTAIWAAGVRPSPLAAELARATGCELDEMGRVVVSPKLSMPDYPDILVLGDMAHCLGRDGRPLPGIAPVAMQQASYLGRLLRARLAGRICGPFRYRHWGMMATIGRSAAVADLGPLQLTGMAGWLAWLFVHLMYIVQFENKLLVLVQWAWNYLTWNRSARLITSSGDD
jgi:NADH dehydrogenase